MAKKRYVMVNELKPENVEDYKNLHKTCLERKNYHVNGSFSSALQVQYPLFNFLSSSLIPEL